MSPRASRLRRRVIVSAACLLFLAALLSGCAGAAGHVRLEASCPQPTAVVAAGDGSLYVASSDAGRVYRIQGERCTELPGVFPRASGLAILDDGTLCVAHAGSDDPLQRRSVVSCRAAHGWSERIGGIGSGVHDLVPAPDGLWLLGWSDTPVDRRDGLVTLTRGGDVVRQVGLPGEVPRFGTVLPDGALWISVAATSAGGTVRPGLVRLDASGLVLRLDPPVRHPEGIAYDRDRDGVWISDADAGALVLVASNHTERARLFGLDRPAGVAVSARYGVCVAEARTNRVRCFGGANAGGGSP